jgi:hypothetical protein
MTDKDWAKLTLHLRLPAETRKPIEAELDLYSRFAAATASPPSKTKKKLEHAAGLTSELLRVIERFGPDEYHALVECTDKSVALSDMDVALAAKVNAFADRPHENQHADAIYAMLARAAFVAVTPRLDSLKLLADQRVQLAALRDRMMRAAVRIDRGKKDAGNARALVKRVSHIIEAQTGSPLSKAKPELHFACVLGSLARPTIGPGSIKEAIENLEPKLASENLPNPG